MRRARASVVTGAVAVAAALLALGRMPRGDSAIDPDADRVAPPPPAPVIALARPIATEGATQLPAGGGRGAAELARPEASSTARLLRAYSSDELALFARVEQLTGRSSASELAELVRLRRAGADERTLVAAATRLFRGDPLGRVAALDWAHGGRR